MKDWEIANKLQDVPARDEPRRGHADADSPASADGGFDGAYSVAATNYGAKMSEGIDSVILGGGEMAIVGQAVFPAGFYLQRQTKILKITPERKIVLRGGTYSTDPLQCFSSLRGAIQYRMGVAKTEMKRVKAQLAGLERRLQKELARNQL